MGKELQSWSISERTAFTHLFIHLYVTKGEKRITETTKQKPDLPANEIGTTP